MRKFLCLIVLLTSTIALFAQSAREIRINEILVKNVDNYMDNYGHRSSWVELHNTGHSKIDIGGCYLVASNNGVETRYQIPTGDPGTLISPMGYTVFFCEGTGTKGTFYTNFTLEDVEWIAFYDPSGRGKPIHKVEINYAEQRPDVSIGYMTNEDAEAVFRVLPQTTPNATNDTEPMMPRSEKFRMMDPTGGIMALTAISVVLSVLTILFLAFKGIGDIMVKSAKRKADAVKPTSGSDGETDQSKTLVTPGSGDEIAAIAMALQMYNEDLHDRESSVLTINRVARAYSPWSSKIYGLRQFPKK